MTIYRDNYPNNIEAPQKLYIQYSHDILFDYSTGKYPDGTEPEWNWENYYIPIPHRINGLLVGRHEWMRIRIGETNTWTFPIRVSANVTNISSISEEIIIENETYTSFSIILTFEDGSTIESEPITIRNGRDGVEIVSAQINGGGHLIITYSDGTVEDAGQAKGADAISIPPMVNDDYLLSQSGGIAVWIDPLQAIGNFLTATTPIEYDFMTGIISHNLDDGNRHIPVGGNLGEALTTDGAGNYSWYEIADEFMYLTGTNSNVEYFQFDLTPGSFDNQPGRFGWDIDNDTLSFGLPDGGSIQVGQETFDYYTFTGGTPVEGDIVSVVVGPGNQNVVTYTDATDRTSAYACIGMVTAVFGGNRVRVTKRGKVRELNTTGYPEGTVIFINPANPGKWTTIQPDAPDYTIIVGQVSVEHSNVGIVNVNPRVVPKLMDLSDINGTPLTSSGQFPVWNDTEGFFDFDYNIQNIATSGFLNNAGITSEYDYNTRTITLTGDLRYLWKGQEKELTSPWTSIAHDATINQSYFLMSQDGDNFIWSTTPWLFGYVMVALVRYRSTAAQTFALREMHGIMDERTHEELHSQLGTYRVSGLAATIGTYTLSSATDADTIPGFDLGIIKDEDLETPISALTQGNYTIFYVGAGSSSVFTLANAFPFVASGGNYMQVNDITTGSMTPGINNRFYNVYQLLIPVTADSNSQAFKMVFIQPQTTYLTLDGAKSEDIRGISLGDLGGTIPEYVTYNRLTYYTLAGYTNTGKCALVSITQVLGNRAGQVTVSGFTPAAHDALTPASLEWTSSGHTGTINTLPKFGSSGEASDSSITDDGTDVTIDANLQVNGQAHGGYYVKTFSATGTFDADDGNNQMMTCTGDTTINITNELPGTYIIDLPISGGGVSSISLGASLGTAYDNTPSLVLTDGSVNTITVYVNPAGTKRYTINTITA